MINRTRFGYGLDGMSEFVTELPARPWTPADDPIGVTRWTATGVPGPVVDRRDALNTLALRIQESEWIAFLAFLDFAQSGATVTWYPDADDASGFPVYIDAPLLGEDLSPTPSAGYERMFDIELTLRGAGVSIPWREYFGD